MSFKERTGNSLEILSQIHKGKEETIECKDNVMEKAPTNEVLLCDPKYTSPIGETPKSDSPRIETPKPDSPMPETPSCESPTPGPETPKPEIPTPDRLISECPAPRTKRLTPLNPT
jgi:hypothetical protein